MPMVFVLVYSWNWERSNVHQLDTDKGSLSRSCTLMAIKGKVLEKWRKNLFCFVLFCFLSFRAAPVAYGGSQARGKKKKNQSCICQPTPQPQQHQVQAASSTYTTAHGNAGSLTHWARPGIEPVSSWMLVRFANLWARTGTPKLCTLNECSSFYGNYISIKMSKLEGLWATWWNLFYKVLLRYKILPWLTGYYFH